MKKLALTCLVVLALVFAWGMTKSNVAITINGEAMTGPLAVVAGGWGIVLSTVVFFCVAILLAFIFAGVGLIVLGVMALVGFILLATAFPFLLPLLIPLLIVWAFCAGTRSKQNKQR